MNNKRGCVQTTWTEYEKDPLFLIRLFYKICSCIVFFFKFISHNNVQLIGIFVSLLLFQNNCIAVLKQKVFLWHFSDFLLCIKVSDACSMRNQYQDLYLSFPFLIKTKYFFVKFESKFIFNKVHFSKIKMQTIFYVNYFALSRLVRTDSSAI